MTRARSTRKFSRQFILGRCSYNSFSDGDFLSCAFLNPKMESSSAPRSVPQDPLAVGGVTVASGDDVSPLAVTE